MKDMYDDKNMTYKEIGKAYNRDHVTIFKHMKKNGIVSRSTAKRNQTKENNSSWKGDKAGVDALHVRLQKERGKANKCEVCNGLSGSKLFEWANLTGDYLDMNDYKMMCRSCHKKYDLKRRKYGSLWSNNFKHFKMGTAVGRVARQRIESR